MMNKSVKRYPLSKQVSDQLEGMIESGEYQVGDRMPTEPELMEIFQVSRNTIREAVQSLTWAGLLEVRQGDGTYVRASNRFLANMKQQYAKVSLDDITEARNALEVTLAHLAAERRNEQDLAEISATLAKREELTDNIKENTHADIEFHMSIARASHNSILMDLYQSISDYLESHIAKKHMEASFDCAAVDAMHEDLYAAIRDGNSARAAACAHKILEI